MSINHNNTKKKVLGEAGVVESASFRLPAERLTTRPSRLTIIHAFQLLLQSCYEKQQQAPLLYRILYDIYIYVVVGVSNVFVSVVPVCLGITIIITIIIKELIQRRILKDTIQSVAHSQF